MPLDVPQDIALEVVEDSVGEELTVEVQSDFHSEEMSGDRSRSRAMAR